MKFYRNEASNILFFTQILIFIFCNIALAQDSNDYLLSPNEPWNDISNIPEDGEDSSSGFFRSVLMYIPNRFLDLIDIFKADVGVGPSLGAVVRVTKYGQAGMRTFMPLSVRIGLLGRQAPAMIETSNEMGVSPAFKKSKDCKVCWGEVGAGVDLLVAGGYLGICPEELFDFIGGIFLLIER